MALVSRESFITTTSEREKYCCHKTKLDELEDQGTKSNFLGGKGQKQWFKLD